MPIFFALYSLNIVDGESQVASRITKFQLASLLFAAASEKPPVISIETATSSETGILCAIEREDGSGRNFNITLSTKDGNKTVFVRTFD